MFLNKTIVEQAASVSGREIDECIYKFLEQQGYPKIREMSIYEINKLKSKWEQEGKQIRCETFIKKRDLLQPITFENYQVETLTIPFFDNIDSPKSRRQVYDAAKLEEEGYML